MKYSIFSNTIIKEDGDLNKLIEKQNNQLKQINEEIKLMAFNFQKNDINVGKSFRSMKTTINPKQATLKKMQTQTKEAKNSNFYNSMKNNLKFNEAVLNTLLNVEHDERRKRHVIKTLKQNNNFLLAGIPSPTREKNNLKVKFDQIKLMNTTKETIESNAYLTTDGKSAEYEGSRSKSRSLLKNRDSIFLTAKNSVLSRNNVKFKDISAFNVNLRTIQSSDRKNSESYSARKEHSNRKKLTIKQDKLKFTATRLKKALVYQENQLISMNEILVKDIDTRINPVESYRKRLPVEKVKEDDLFRPSIYNKRLNKHSFFSLNEIRKNNILEESSKISKIQPETSFKFKDIITNKFRENNKNNEINSKNKDFEMNHKKLNKILDETLKKKAEIFKFLNKIK